MAKSVSRLIIFPSGVEKARLSQAIQSSQQKRSRSSANCQTNQSNENPYRAGQPFAGPASSAAHALSSCSKNRAIRSRTFAVRRSLSLRTSLLSSAFRRPLGLFGSAPRKTRIERRSSAGFFQDHQKSKREKIPGERSASSARRSYFAETAAGHRDPANCTSRLVHRSR